MTETTLLPYPAIDRDFAYESRDGSVSPMRVVREMAANASAHGAPIMAKVLNDACDDENRRSHELGRYKLAIRRLLFALHAHPMHSEPPLPLEEAIAQAIALLPEGDIGAILPER